MKWNKPRKLKNESAQKIQKTGITPSTYGPFNRTTAFLLGLGHPHPSPSAIDEENQNSPVLATQHFRIDPVGHFTSARDLRTCKEEERARCTHGQAYASIRHDGGGDGGDTP